MNIKYKTSHKKTIIDKILYLSAPIKFKCKMQKIALVIPHPGHGIFKKYLKGQT